MMRYAELRRHVWMLWREARYLDPIDGPYRKWITERTLDRVFEAALVTDDAPDELAKHLAHDYRFDNLERSRFMFWWNHVMEKGFDSDNPLAHLHKKVAVKA
jgi:hypothetical protein